MTQTSTVRPRPILIVQGGQWGSEAKGAVAAKLCLDRNVKYAVRTGTINAGHTVYYPTSPGGPQVECKMQQLPTGWVNPDTELVIGPGAFIETGTLLREIDLISKVTGRDVRDRLFIDYRCGLHHPGHAGRSKVSGRHHRMGATGKGCSEALIDKITNRNNGYKLWWEYYQEELRDTLKDSGGANEGMDLSMCITDTTRLLHTAYDVGDQILLEGTQGTFLDLHLGPYPYTTHKQTTASQWVTEAGLSPAMEYEVVLVLRTYPIRVAGNSGPMPQEMSWAKLARRINSGLIINQMGPRVQESSIRMFEEAIAKVAASRRYSTPIGSTGLDQHLWSPEDRDRHREFLSEANADALRMLPDSVVEDLQNLFELTTVTRKLRRVAEFDLHMAKEAVTLNRPSEIALTFLNYEFPTLWGKTSIADQHGGSVAQSYIDSIESELGVPVTYASTGPYSEHLIRLHSNSNSRG